MASEAQTTNLITPYGGKLVNLMVTDGERQELLERSSHLPSVQISARALCDLELLATGAFSPMDRFMRKADYERVLTEMRLNNGILFPMRGLKNNTAAPLTDLENAQAVRGYFGVKF